ncbi:T6SS immunity protein Tdi1 domain-containing protein [uncultured Massilia sp.]|uniref:T6SS immunity protein Tdi1 domain-containing protein n=1 Tax=uncultured Massilia sp. TaxID=169973 RepID=UPI00258E3DE4|nr:T6SS immunity protein Tdi1 domain-containing protein [uncultured Massilia sp.]
MATNQEFLYDWYMRDLVDQAFQRFGVLAPGRKYCLKIPGVLGGEYGGDNLGTIAFDELIRASGHLAQQIAGLPDGASVKLSVYD